MNCPACDHSDTSVVDSRPTQKGQAIRRRRSCESCQYRFSTLELPQLKRIVVRKRSGNVEPYDSAKLEQGIRRAFQKRPVSEQQIRSLIAEVEQDIARIWRIARQTNKDAPSVNSHDIGESIVDRLKEIDPIAYIRFVSVYNSFSTIDEFENAVARARMYESRQQSLSSALDASVEEPFEGS